MVLRSRIWFSGPGLTTQNRGMLTRDIEHIHKLWKERIWQETCSSHQEYQKQKCEGKEENYPHTTGNCTGQRTRSVLVREEWVRRVPFISVEKWREEGRIWADLQGLLANTQTQKPRELDILTQCGILTSLGSQSDGTSLWQEYDWERICPVQAIEAAKGYHHVEFKKN